MLKKNNVPLRAGIAVAVLLLLAVAIVSYYTIDRLIKSSKMVEHTYRILQVSENILSELKDGETGQRGFLLTKQPDFLQPYNGSRERALESLKDLKTMTTDNLQQQINCDSLHAMIVTRFNILDQSIDDAKNDLPVNVFRLRDGFTFMQQTTLLIKRMQHIEESLLRSRLNEQEKYVRFAPIAIIAGSILSLLITILLFGKVINDFKQKSRLAEELYAKELEITNRIDAIEALAAQLSRGDYKLRLKAEDKDKLGSLAGSLNSMAIALDDNFEKLKRNQWLQQGAAMVADKIAGEKDVKTISGDAINAIVTYTDSQIGALYLESFDGILQVQGGVALPIDSQRKTLRPGEGLAGQTYFTGEPRWIKDIEESLYTTYSGGTLRAKELLLFPISFEDKSIGVLELGTTGSYQQTHLDFLSRISEFLGIAINTARNREQLKELLEETQAQSEELQAQHEELENTTAELEMQAEKLQTSEEELKVQQEELMETNQELEERSRLLEEKNHVIVLRNLDIQKKAEELEQSTRYKSEFLANMSHELRTPLNSVLLLSRLLSENTEGNLNTEQVEYAQVIQSSGNGLLQLIDEILDLSKIESGKLDLEYESVSVSDIIQNMRMLFQPMAAEKNVSFNIRVDDSVPGIIETDRLRLEQILKNLLSNALKFTSHGSIDLIVSPSLQESNSVSFTVADTGIGVPQDKQQLIFEAFQQADGSTKRKYGGTGLGLSISRQLARLLSGDIVLESREGAGSRFTLTVPLFRTIVEKETATQPAAPTPAPTAPAPASVVTSTSYTSKDIPNALPDDRATIGEGDKVILLVEDDIISAKTLIDLTRKRGYKVIHIVRGDLVLDAALTYHPSGILLDIQLPVKDGLSVLDELKNDPRTRHIPIHVISSFEMRKESLNRGAVDFASKPLVTDQMNAVLERIENAVKSETRKVLIVEDNTYHAKALAHFLSNHNIQAEISDNINRSVTKLHEQETHCVILDMGLPGPRAYEALEIVKQDPTLEKVPIIIFTGQSVSRQEEQRIRQYADAIIVKTAQSYQRILNEVSLFLHMVDQPSKTGNRGTFTRADEVLKNKTVLVADDDVRNIFALTKALEKNGMMVVPAVDGKEALKVLESNDRVDIVLMDMMMPEMDGFEAISNIRSNSKWKRLPVIAVTAKAMLGDREKCLQAGASDYISKPVDTDQLLSLMRVWLFDSIQK